MFIQFFILIYQSVLINLHKISSLHEGLRIMVYANIIDMAHLGMLCNFCGYAYFPPKFVKNTHAAAFKACFARILAILPWSIFTIRYFIII